MRGKLLLGSAFAVGLGLFANSQPVNAISGTIDIEGQKVVSGMEMAGGEYTFELRKAGSDTILKTATNDADGRIVFEDVSFSDADILNGKYITYVVTERPGNDETIVYDNNKGYVVVELVEGTSEVENIAYEKPIAEDIDYSDFEFSIYNATDDELQGVAYTVFDSRDGSLTFFRDEAGKYADDQYVYFGDDGSVSDRSTSSYLRYNTFSEDDDTGFDGEDFTSKYLVKSVVFKDAIRPKKINFKRFSACESYDLKKLDTSLMTSMQSMFAGNSKLKEINISNFDVSNVESMLSMFDEDALLEHVIWGNIDTGNVQRTGAMFRGTSLDYFDFSKFNTASLTNADDMFNGVTGNIGLKKMDFSTWRDNVNYSTATIGTKFPGEYLNIKNWKTTYSAEFYDLRKVKVIELCYPSSASVARSPLINQNGMINVETGEVVSGSDGQDAIGKCGTYVALDGESMEFVNRKKARVVIEKVDEEGRDLPGATLALKMDGSVIYEWLSDGDAKEFDNLLYGHEYEVVELEAPYGFKKADPITFEVSDEGAVMRDGQEISEINFVNKEDKIKIKKVWEDEGYEAFRPSEVTFEILSNIKGEKIGEVTLDANDASDSNTWEGEFSDFVRYEGIGFEDSFKVVEKDSWDNYSTDYETEDAERSPYAVIGDEVTVYNKFEGALTNYPVLKRWTNDEEGDRPASVKFKIYDANDMTNPVSEIELTSEDVYEGNENEWLGTFEGLRILNNDGEKINYVVVEDDVEGYENSYAYVDGFSPDSDYANMLKLTCSSERGGGNFAFMVDMDNTTPEGQMVVVMGGANGTDFYVPIDGINYELFLTGEGDCAGEIVYTNSSKASYSGVPMSRYAINNSISTYTEKTMSGKAVSGANGERVRFKIEVPENEQPGGESDEPFAGANVVINNKIEEQPDDVPEEKTEEIVDTGDKIVVPVIVFALSLAGVAVFAVKRRG